MSAATDLLQIAKQSGIDLNADGEQLRVKWHGTPPPPALIAELKANKAELLLLLATPVSEHYEKIVIAQDAPLISPDSVQCQTCLYLSNGGECIAKLDYKPIPHAWRKCSKHHYQTEKRVMVADAPYSETELDALLARYEAKLIEHLIKCPHCRVTDRRWCNEGVAIGSSYDALLMSFNDAIERFDKLITKTIKARLRAV